jgi:cytochrome P450
VRRLDAILFRFIRERRASGEDRDDLLSRLLHARDEDNGQGMSDKQLRDECMTLFLAGHETTALGLSYTWYLLSQYPDALAKLRAELASVLGGRLPTGTIYRGCAARSTSTESMRVLPPVYAVGREATEDVTVGGVRVSKGQTLFLPQWVVHRDPRWYDRPNEFDPDRWEGGLAQRIPKYAYFPFGGGPRVCIGNHFATTEAVLVLATLARWRFEYDESRPLELWPSMTLRPRARRAGVLRRHE